MPYKLSKDGLSVIDDAGKVVGKRHANRKQALAHLAALNINVVKPELKKKMVAESTYFEADIAPHTNGGDFAGMGNNQMLCADPSTGEIRRFMVGPVACEVTGISFSPDQKTLFVGIQHPGETGGSTWPEHLPNGKPRSSVMAIRRDDGGIVGA